MTSFSTAARRQLGRLGTVGALMAATLPFCLAVPANPVYFSGRARAEAAASANVGPVTPDLRSPDPVIAGSTTSANWSGYVEVNGPFTAVRGTFVVPSVRRGTAGATISEWVGIDGWGSKSLIQAGVNEVPQNGSTALVSPWWEVLPAPQTPVTGVVVHAGDSVSITIRRISGARWAIVLTDNTNGDRFDKDTLYHGQLSSAEWILEANEKADGTPTELAPYRPEVHFTDLGTAGPQTTARRVVMAQRGQDVSTPSASLDGQFAVAFGSAVPVPGS